MQDGDAACLSDGTELRDLEDQVPVFENGQILSEADPLFSEAAHGDSDHAEARLVLAQMRQDVEPADGRVRMLGRPPRLASVINVGDPLLAATLSAHESASFGEHESAGFAVHGGPLAALNTISPA
jgi:hypothetical protein